MDLVCRLPYILRDAAIFSCTKERNESEDPSKLFGFWSFQWFSLFAYSFSTGTSVKII